MTRLWLPQNLSFLAFLVLLVPSGLGEVLRPSESELGAFIAGLRDADFAKREAATLFLWKHAEAAEGMLREAAQAPDPETLVRARRVLEAFELGIFPDTPPEIVRGIYQFRDGTRQQKKQFVDQLIASDEFVSAHRLIRTVSDEALRMDLIRLVSGRVKERVVLDLLNDDVGKARKTLEKAALEDYSMRDYAAFGERIGMLDQLLEEHVSDKEHPMLWKRQAWLHRAADDMDAAVQLGELHEDALWVAEVRAANGDPVAFCEGQLTSEKLLPLQRLRLKCAQARLLGDIETTAALLEKIEEWAQNEPNTYNKRLALDALVLNDRVDRAVQLIPDLAGQLPFEVLTYRGTYGVALESLGLGRQRPPYSPWIEDMCEKIKAQDKDALSKAVELATRVYGLGEKDEAARMYDLIFAALADRQAEQKNVVRQAVNVGAREVVAKLLTELHDSGVEMRELQLLLFERNSELLQQWYELIRQIHLEKSLVECLVAAWELLDVRDSSSKPALGARMLLEQGHDALQKLGPGESDGYLYYLYLTAYLQEAYDLAARYLAEFLESKQNPEFLVQLGALHGLQDQWNKAAANYQQAWTLSLEVAKSTVKGRGDTGMPFEIQPTYLYLTGMAHRKAGDVSKGDAMVAQARLLCLGDIAARYEVARAMEQNGDDELAIEEWALIARLSRLNEGNGTWSFLHLAGPLSKTDPAKAADYQERVTVARDQLNVRSQFTFNVQLRARAHQWRAQGCLKNGNVAGALESLKTYWAVTPGNASIAEELLPMLEEAGQVEVAFDYYEKTRVFALEACTLFPKSAMAHNNLAWLDARSRRHLDEAMKHAQMAVKLLPNTAAYIDTVAEVHFALGDRERALEFSAKAVELTPDDQELVGQRKRFESAPLPPKR